MTDLIVTAVADAEVRSANPSTNFGSTAWVGVKSGEKRGFLLPELGNIAGRTVLAATLVGRVGPGHVAQTYTVSPVIGKWSPGRVTWTNQPLVNGVAAVTEAVGALADGALVEVDVTAIVQAVADGTPWYGVRVATNSTTASQRFYATDSGEPAWELLVSLSDAPDQPSDLRPDGGAVSTGEPVLAWNFTDLGGESTEQAESRVQVDSPAVGVDPDEVTPDYDSGWVSNVDPEYDLAVVTYTPPGSPAQSTFWRVKVRDGAGVESEWSDWANFTVDSLPTLVVDSPTGAFGDPSPQLIAHLTGGTLTHWKAFVTGADRSDVRYESGMSTGPIDWQIPLRNEDGRRVLKESEAGWIYLKAWDDVNRAVAVGEKAYVDVWIPADLTDDDTVTAPTGLSVVQIAPGDPRSEWTWQLPEAAPCLVEVDGDTLVRLEPEDMTINAGTYSWTDNGEIGPLRPHNLRVRALEGSKKSEGASITRSHTVTGVWLLPEDGEAIMLDGVAVSGFARTDRVATYEPLRGNPIDIIYDTPGRTGAFEGTVDSRQDVWAVLDQIDALRKSRNRKARMVWGSQSILVRLRDPDATTSDAIMPNNLEHVVRFGFVEVGE